MNATCRPSEKGPIVKAQLQYKVVLIYGLIFLEQVNVDCSVVEDFGHLLNLADGVPKEEVALSPVVQYETVFVFILAKVGRRTETRVT